MVYESKIRDNHLVDGMVVNRFLNNGRMKDECDSLLFSSIRFVALKKLGLASEAHRAWNAITQIVRDDFLLRHPQCLKKPPSRDMILGFLMTHLYLPKDGKEVFKEFMSIVNRNGRFFSTDKTHYSFLTPQIALLARHVARLYRIPFSEMPNSFREGFPTSEWSSLVVKPGYRTHLIALSTWIEMEIYEQKNSQNQGFNTPNISIWQQPTELWTAQNERIDLTRLRFLTQQLVDADSANLFYRWLRLKTAGLLTDQVRYKMLWELIQMKQFPKNSLPMNCDRKADYMWMRASWESRRSKIECSYQFAGVDFLWMAALLLEEER